MLVSNCYFFKVYVDIGSEPGDTATIDVNVKSAAAGATNTNNRNWDIKVAQIECGSETR